MLEVLNLFRANGYKTYIVLCFMKRFRHASVLLSRPQKASPELIRIESAHTFKQREARLRLLVLYTTAYYRHRQRPLESRRQNPAEQKASLLFGRVAARQTLSSRSDSAPTPALRQLERRIPSKQAFVGRPGVV
jgi:hypothetical protein